MVPPFFIILLFFIINFIVLIVLLFCTIKKLYNFVSLYIRKILTFLSFEKLPYIKPKDM